MRFLGLCFGPPSATPAAPSPAARSASLSSSSDHRRRQQSQHTRSTGHVSGSGVRCHRHARVHPAEAQAGRSCDAPHRKARLASICHSMERGQHVAPPGRVCMCTRVQAPSRGQCACTPRWVPVHGQGPAADQHPSALSQPHSHTEASQQHTTHAALAHKLCVPSTRARTPSTVPLLGSGGASQSRELHWLASQRGRLGERGVGGAAAAGKTCLK